MPGSWLEEKGTRLPGPEKETACLFASRQSQFARYVLFRLIKKRSFNLLCVLKLKIVRDVDTV